MLFAILMRLLEKEDDNGSGGGGTGAPASPPADDPPADDPPADDPLDKGEKMVPQSEVDRIVAREKRKAAERARREASGDPDPTPKGKPQGDKTDDLADKYAQLEARNTVGDLLQDAGITLPRKRRERLVRMYRSESPDDPEGWLDDLIEEGWLSKPAPAGEGDDDRQTKSAKQGQRKPGPKLPPRGPGRVELPGENDIDPLKMTPEQIAELKQTQGAGAFKKLWDSAVERARAQVGAPRLPSPRKA